MNILLLGSGGREHAIARKIADSPQLSKLYMAPGNGGTSSFCTNVNIGVGEFEKINDFIQSNDIDMLVVGPEAPLADGLVDYLKKDNANEKLMVIGPCLEGARLESSKDFAKQFMVANDIPTARYRSFTSENVEEGCRFLETLNAPYVLKADGLAAGKGVLIIEELEEAKVQLKEMLINSKFGKASGTVVIEEFLSGIELSVFIITDGNNYVILPEAKDYKRIGEKDTGLNTGGMGSISPVPFANQTFMQKVEDKIIKPTVKGLKNNNIDYCGFIFFGLINCNGEPYVIEYNCRMGDPETESVFPRINNDIIEVFKAAANKTLDTITIDIKKETAATIMLVAEGYPEKYPKGMKISFDDINENDIIFHAGTALDNDNNVVTSGGRVITATALGNNLEDALQKAYLLTEKINFDHKYFRKDIGFDLIDLK